MCYGAGFCDSYHLSHLGTLLLLESTVWAAFHLSKYGSHAQCEAEFKFD
jgi:hypothetical protein